MVVCGIFTLLNSNHVKNNGARGLEAGDPSSIFSLFIIISYIFILSQVELAKQVLDTTRL